MRGYRALKQSDQLIRITEVKEALANTRLAGDNACASVQLFGAALKNAELIVRQYLMVRAGNNDFNKSLLSAIGRKGAVVHPLPPEWRTVIERQGFKVARVRSAVAWNVFVGLMLGYGLFSLLKRIGSDVRAVMAPRPALGRYAYFDSLSTGNLPQVGATGRSHNIIEWYQQWPDRTSGLDSICHGVPGVTRRVLEDFPVIPLPSAIPPLGRLRALLGYTGWGAGAGLLALVDLLRGNWWHALLLNEAVKSASVRLQNPDKLARDYLFHNSGWIYRPLWSYEAEAKGSRVIFYFYSTNCEGFKRPTGYPIQAHCWQLMNWPLYLVWDKAQADFVRRAVGQGPAIRVVGPILFHAVEAEELPSLNRASVAVFDITPVRESIYVTLGADLEYYVPAVCIEFLRDIQLVAEAQGLLMHWKHKRKLQNASRAHPMYRGFVATVVERDNVRLIDADLSATLVISTSAAVISMPFTSTAIIAREMNKPTCYYDPTGLLQKDDRAAHGIEIISGREELARWLCSAARASGQTTPGSGLKDRPKAAGLVG